MATSACRGHGEGSVYRDAANRQDWEHATAGSRHLAVRAAAELRRRYPGGSLIVVLLARTGPRMLARCDRSLCFSTVIVRGY